MDFRVNDLQKIRRFPMPQDGLRAVAQKAAQRAPQAEALAASWFETARPLTSRVYAMRRRIGTAAVVVLTGLLFVHVMLGANGMIVYKQKRAEYQVLQKRIAAAENENKIYTQKIQAMKSDEKAIEKEAREQLRYARPGEYVYVPAAQLNPPAGPVNHSAKK